MNNFNEYFEYNSNNLSDNESDSKSPIVDVDNELILLNQHGLSFELSRFPNQPYNPEFPDLQEINLPVLQYDLDTESETNQVKSPINPHIFNYIPGDSTESPTSIKQEDDDATPAELRSPVWTGSPIRAATPIRTGSPAKSPSKSHRRQDSQQPIFEESPRKRKRESSSYQSNEKELKLIAHNSIRLDINQMVNHLKMVESEIDDAHIQSNTIFSSRLPRDSKRQVFAMIWLLNNCELSPTSVVTRNRVYAKYVSFYSNFGLFPLSPANLGKLVKILFPNLTIRRLGVKGMSKYHYCGIKIVDDNEVMDELQFNLGKQKPLIRSNLDKSFQIIHYKYIRNMFLVIKSSLDRQNLNSSIDFPPIYPYLPKDADMDIADTLYYLYKVTNTSMFENFRYLKLDNLLGNILTFHSILTTPVFKLYTDPSIFEWIYNCDLITFKLMIKLLAKVFRDLLDHSESGIVFEVLHKLNLIASHFHGKLVNAMDSKLPPSLINLKSKCAMIFTRYLKRFIRLMELTLKIKANFSNLHDAQQLLFTYKRIDFNLIVGTLPFNSLVLNKILTVFRQHVPNLFTLFSYQNLQLIMDYLFSDLNVNLRFFKVYALKLVNELFQIFSQDESFEKLVPLKIWIDEFLTIYLEMGAFVDVSESNTIYDNRGPDFYDFDLFDVTGSGRDNERDDRGKLGSGPGPSDNPPPFGDRFEDKSEKSGSDRTESFDKSFDRSMEKYLNKSFDRTFDSSFEKTFGDMVKSELSPVILD